MLTPVACQGERNGTFRRNRKPPDRSSPSPSTWTYFSTPVFGVDDYNRSSRSWQIASVDREFSRNAIAKHFTDKCSHAGTSAGLPALDSDTGFCLNLRQFIHRGACTRGREAVMGRHKWCLCNSFENTLKFSSIIYSSVQGLLYLLVDR